MARGTDKSLTEVTEKTRRETSVRQGAHGRGPGRRGADGGTGVSGPSKCGDTTSESKRQEDGLRRDGTDPTPPFSGTPDRAGTGDGLTGGPSGTDGRAVGEGAASVRVTPGVRLRRAPGHRRWGPT